MFITIGYRGHWLHYSANADRWRVQLPDYTVLAVGFRSLRSARAFVRARIHGEG